MQSVFLAEDGLWGVNGVTGLWEVYLERFHLLYRVNYVSFWGRVYTPANISCFGCDNPSLGESRG